MDSRLRSVPQFLRPVCVIAGAMLVGLGGAAAMRLWSDGFAWDRAILASSAVVVGAGLAVSGGPRRMELGVLGLIGAGHSP